MKKGLNINENLDIRDEYYVLGKKLHNRILELTKSPIEKLVIAIGGESGCGKSTTAVCLEKEFVDSGINSTTLHMDSYFKIPPKDNHQNRVKSLKNVGPHEVNIMLLNKQIEAFKNDDTNLEIPVVNYEENRFTTKRIDLSGVDVLIVEGVYSFLLDNIDHKIFLTRTYHDTYKNRRKRTRENYDPFIEQILEIEHNIVSPMIEDADLIIMQNYVLK